MRAPVLGLCFFVSVNVVLCGLSPMQVGCGALPSLDSDREDASSMVTAGATADNTEGNSRASRESGFCWVHIHTGNLSTADTMEGNSRASRESGLLCSHSHGESIDRSRTVWGLASAGRVMGTGPSGQRPRRAG